MDSSVIGGNVFVQGNLSAESFTAPAGCIADGAIVGNAGIAASKLTHQFAVHYSTSAGSAVTADTLPVHIVNSSSGATVAYVKATLLTACTSTDTVTVDLQRSTGGGSFSTILSASLAFTSSIAAKSILTATISAGTLVQNDILQVVVTVTGTSGKGLVVDCFLQEKAN